MTDRSFREPPGIAAFLQAIVNGLAWILDIFTSMRSMEQSKILTEVISTKLLRSRKSNEFIRMSKNNCSIVIEVQHGQYCVSTTVIAFPDEVCILSSGTVLWPWFLLCQRICKVSEFFIHGDGELFSSTINRLM